MGDINTLITRMRYWCASANLGYDQSQRWNIYPGGECDCSSLVIHCLKEAGFDTGSSSYTGNMSSQLTARGWRRLPNNGNPQPGDILLNDIHHVAVYLGNGQLAQASIDERGRGSGGRSGDQTDHETNIRRYYNYPWNAYLRYAGPIEGASMTSAQDVWNYDWNHTANGGNTYNALMGAATNTAHIWNYLQPRFIGAKDTHARLLWIPGQGIIPMYEPREMQEMSEDYRNITGHQIPTVLYRTERQMRYAIAILNNESAEDRRRLRP
ncbi:NlpC/P60 family protein [Bifidobacterium callitrichos]|uniref:Peptidoglycan hydrolase n=1 Tax=Bifidobacterium callitrichos DSM 23973 TaxID=1437609 RepID=A0A087ACV0_9BIFI|nr:NlpC/P60 family protein [Bifidobacterium callitrichos]KFI56600.1 peptidoglycan hydrolase [Bifidobacterium callitrichos DSM 23973]